MAGGPPGEHKPKMNFAAALASSLPQVVHLRHRLHGIPELSDQEHKTAALIREELARARIPFTAGVPDAPIATIALIGDPSKPCVALRADIDALPVEEETSLDACDEHLASKPWKPNRLTGVCS